MQREIQEGNKLIAEFSKYKEMSASAAYCYDNDIMAFHFSWDWIMPVVRQIEVRLPEKEGRKEYFDALPFGREMKDGGIILFVPNDIEIVYNAVLKFIQWYNQHSK